METNTNTKPHAIASNRDARSQPDFVAWCEKAGFDPDSQLAIVRFNLMRGQ